MTVVTDNAGLLREAAYRLNIACRCRRTSDSEPSCPCTQMGDRLVKLADVLNEAADLLDAALPPRARHVTVAEKLRGNF